MNTLIVGISRFDMGSLSLALDSVLPRNPLRDQPTNLKEHEKVIKIAESFKGYESGDELDHVSATMLIDCELAPFVDLVGCSKLHHVIRKINEDEVLALVSGTIREWVDTTVRMTTKERSIDTRALGNAIQIRFDEKGYGKLWKEHTTFIKLDDRTYIIKPRN